MSFTIESGKETGVTQSNVTPRPLILCQITATDGNTVYLTTAASTGHNYITYNGHNYLARLQSQTFEAIQAQSAQGYDIPGNITLTIADGDLSLWTNNANAHGWRGAALTVSFVLWDVVTNAYSTNAYVWNFILGKPNIDARGVITVEATARTSMTRLKVPGVPRQNRCPWVFPSDSAGRTRALTDPTAIEYQCGYSADISGGVGNLNSGSPYTSCTYTAQACKDRGMYSKDSSNRTTSRFGGDTWISPQEWRGREYVTGNKTLGFNTPNPPGSAYYNLLYGTQWVDATVLEPAGDPNSDRAECIVCIACDGPVNIQKVVVNGVEVPQNNGDVLFTWRYLNQGGRNGFISTDAIYNGTGDPHGSMCSIEVVVPKELANPGSIPKVQVLAQGPPTLLVYPISNADGSGSGGKPRITFPGVNALCAGNSPFQVVVKGNGYIPDGSYGLSNWTYSPGDITLNTSALGAGSSTTGYVYFFVANTNPVWHLMDLLTWGPFKVSDFDPLTWYNAAAICDQSVSYLDLNGNSSSHARYRSSFVLSGQNRQTLAQAVLGLRNNAGIILARNPTNGLLQCFIEQTLADQQGSAITGSNYNTPVSSVNYAGTTTNGYLAYLFDGKDSIEKDSFRLDGRSINDTPNRVGIQFQDEDNVWQSDSLSQIDPLAYKASGNQEIDVPLSVLGIANFDQATRRANVELAKAIYGNTRSDEGGTEFPEFTTSVKAAHLASRVGYICGLNYAQLGLSMALFRVLSAQPSTDGEKWTIKGRFHHDSWHTDAYGQNPAPFYRQPDIAVRPGPPYPWKPNVAAASNDVVYNGRNVFGLTVDVSSYPAAISISGDTPVNAPPTGNIPQVPLQATTNNTGGSIPPGSYSVAITANGIKGPVSRLISAVVPAGTNTNTITVSGIVWGAAVASPAPYIGENGLTMRLSDPSNYTSGSPDGYGNPTSFTLTAITPDGAGLPDTNFHEFYITQTGIVHGGVWGDAVTSVSGAVLTFAGSGGLWSTNQWQNYVLSLYYRPGLPTGVPQPTISLGVASSTSSTLTLTSSSPAFLPNDVVVMRAKSAHITSNTIGDDNFQNSYNGNAGLTTDQDAGKLIQIISGTGAGQAPKTIRSNTHTVYTINGSWDVTPDSTSIFIVIEPSPANAYATNPVNNDGAGATPWVIASTHAVLTQDQQLLIQVATADADGNAYPMRYQPFREIYIPPQSLAGSSTGGEYSIPITTLTPTLTGSIAATDTTMSLSSLTGLPAGPFLAVVDGECIYCASGSSNPITITRGWNGSAPASHSSGATATIMLATPDMSYGLMQAITLTGHTTVLAPINSTGPQSFTLDLVQDMTGGHAALFSTKYKGFQASSVTGGGWDQTASTHTYADLAIRASTFTTLTHVSGGPNFPV
jgi:hypothetical protein